LRQSLLLYLTIIKCIPIFSIDGILSTIFGVEQFIGGTKINFDWQADY
jgi:hypothetical protein